VSFSDQAHYSGGFMLLACTVYGVGPEGYIWRCCGPLIERLHSGRLPVTPTCGRRCLAGLPLFSTGGYVATAQKILNWLRVRREHDNSRVFASSVALSDDRSGLAFCVCHSSPLFLRLAPRRLAHKLRECESVLEIDVKTFTERVHVRMNQH